MILVSMHTGVRQGELFRMRWEDLNFTEGLLTIHGPTAKSSQTRHIPLNSIALDALKAWKSQSDPSSVYVFPSEAGGPFDNVKKSWATLLTSAGITSFRWHDLRHHFASRLVTAGVDLNTVRELLGHSDLKMTLRYSHLAPQVKRAAVEKLVERPSTNESTLRAAK
jgi:integrase